MLYYIIWYDIIWTHREFVFSLGGLRRVSIRCLSSAVLQGSVSGAIAEWSRNPRPQPQIFSKSVFVVMLIIINIIIMSLSLLSPLCFLELRHHRSYLAWSERHGSSDRPCNFQLFNPVWESSQSLNKTWHRHVCVSLSLYICMYVCIYIYIHIYIYTYVCIIYIYIYI